MKASIDVDRCIGAGNCAEICPEVFELRDDGLAHVINGDPDPSLYPSMEEAAEACPTGAVILAEDDLKDFLGDFVE